MTHAELYDIVKDHRDVWGRHFKWHDTRELFMEQDHQSINPTRSDIVEAALLGLGVKWLVERKAHPGTGYPIGKDGSFSCWVDPKVGCDFWDRRECRGPSILAAIYAAISEVKRETKDPH